MYVTSAIAKTKSSASAANSTAKPKDLSNEASLITIATLPSRNNVVNMSSGLEKRLPGDRSELSGRPYEVKNGGLGSINEVNLETENIYTSHSSMESHVKPIQSEVSPVAVPVEHKKHVTFQETIQTDDLEPPLQMKISDYTSTVPEIHRADRPSVPQDYKPEVLSTMSHNKLTRTLSSPTGQSAPLTLPKLSTFITPKPFTSTNSSSFSSAVTSPVKRSQSFSSSISPVKQQLNANAPIGWSSVTSPVEFKKDSLVFPESSEEILENEVITSIPKRADFCYSSIIYIDVCICHVFSPFLYSQSVFVIIIFITILLTVYWVAMQVIVIHIEDFSNGIYVGNFSSACCSQAGLRQNQRSFFNQYLSFWCFMYQFSYRPG